MIMEGRDLGEDARVLSNCQSSVFSCFFWISVIFQY